MKYKSAVFFALTVLALAAAVVWVIWHAPGSKPSPMLDAVKIDKELNRLRGLKHANWCWAKLQHKQVGVIRIEDRQYPVYHDSSERMVYIYVRDKSEIPVYLTDQSEIRKELKAYAKRLGIDVTLVYSAGSTQELLALVNEKPSPYDARIDELEKQFEAAIRQVEHDSLVVKGTRHKVLSDPSYQYFVVISPETGARPKPAEARKYVSDICGRMGTVYKSIQHETDPSPPNWLRPIRRILRR